MFRETSCYVLLCLVQDRLSGLGLIRLRASKKSQDIQAFALRRKKRRGRGRGYGVIPIRLDGLGFENHNKIYAK